MDKSHLIGKKVWYVTYSPYNNNYNFYSAVLKEIVINSRGVTYVMDDATEGTGMFDSKPDTRVDIIFENHEDAYSHIKDLLIKDAEASLKKINNNFSKCGVKVQALLVYPEE